MTVFSKTVAERTRPGQRQDVEEQGTFPSPFPSPTLLIPPLRLHLPCLLPHGRNLRHHNQQPGLPRASRAPAALESRRRIPRRAPPLHLRELEPYTEFP